MIKVGFIDYKNTIPFGIGSIKGIEIIRDVPARLNQLIYQDKIDVGIISSAEYIEHYFKYFIFPHLSISSKDRSMSVLILSNKPIHQTDKIYLTKESKTSVFLAKIILEKFLGLKPEYRQFESPKNKDTILVIGDLALKLRDGFKHAYDLAEIWYKETGLPFTFALWCVRKEFLLENREEVYSFYLKLKENTEKFLNNIHSYIDIQTVEYLKNLDYSLQEKHIKSLKLFSEYLYQMKLIKSLPDFRFIDGVVITRDGTKTVYNFDYQEAYHSTKAGAYTESLEKFVKPSNLEKLLKLGKKVKILDVGFGLGYNVATAINFARKISNNPHLEIISVEKDANFINNIKNVDYPDSLSEEYKLILSLKEDRIEIGGKVVRCYRTYDGGISLTVLMGEGRELIKSILEEGKKFDIVFYDPFSPKVNTEMWTVDMFKLISGMIDDEGTFLTYSGAIPVKVGLIEAGFKIGYVKPVGRRTPSIIATKKGEIDAVPQEEVERLIYSEFGVPYRDEGFSLTAKEIFENWEKEVKSRHSRPV